MSHEEAMARGDAVMKGFEENHPTLMGVARALGTSKLTRWPDAGDYAGTGKHMYRAECAGVGVTVPVFPLNQPKHAGAMIERAQRRVSLLSQIHSPHVVRVLSDAVAIKGAPGAVCWVEELLPSTKFEDDLASQEHVWDVGQAHTMLAEVGAGVAAFHALGARAWPYPYSLRLRSTGEFVLVNTLFIFRLPIVTPDVPAFPDFGLPGLVSPEDTPGGKPTLASDIFKLGAFAFLVLTGTLPIPCADRSIDGVATFYTDLRTKQAPPIRTLRADMPARFAAVIDRCLQRNPLDRYQNASEMLDDLVQHRP